MPPNTSKRWSNSLLDATRQALREVPVTPDGRIRMKQWHGKFGSFDALELTADKYSLRLEGSGEILSFSDPDTVVAAGWAID